MTQGIPSNGVPAARFHTGEVAHFGKIQLAMLVQSPARNAAISRYGCGMVGTTRESLDRREIFGYIDLPEFIVS